MLSLFIARAAALPIKLLLVENASCQHPKSVGGVSAQLSSYLDLVTLLSAMSQFLSVCVPSDFHRWERPSIVASNTLGRTAATTTHEAKAMVEALDRLGISPNTGLPSVSQHHLHGTWGFIFSDGFIGVIAYSCLPDLFLAILVPAVPLTPNKRLIPPLSKPERPDLNRQPPEPKSGALPN